MEHFLYLLAISSISLILLLRLLSLGFDLGGHGRGF